MSAITAPKMMIPAMVRLSERKLSVLLFLLRDLLVELIAGDSNAAAESIQLVVVHAILAAAQGSSRHVGALSCAKFSRCYQ
jgi:hypothetical protein